MPEYNQAAIEYMARTALFSMEISKQNGKSEKEAFEYAAHTLSCLCNSLKIMPNDQISGIMKVSIEAAMLAVYGLKPQFQKIPTIQTFDLKA